MDEEYNFRDRDVFLYGQTQSIQSSYDEFWASPLSIPISWLLKPQKEEERQITFFNSFEFSCDPKRYAPSFRDRIAQIPQSFFCSIERLQGALQWVEEMQYISDKPIKNTSEGLLGGGESTEGLIALLDKAKSVCGFKPVFGSDGFRALSFSAAADRGIEVKMITNSLAATDSYAAFNGYQSIRGKLLEMGVELYEFRPDAKIRGQIHSRDPKSFKTPHMVCMPSR